ncbi:MAG: 50S ribosomal protein L30 [Candidatus Omnitrophica bacterium]|nr:50S ribosomal protein L30 [Candidatus Omnitrophota bacterium]
MVKVKVKQVKSTIKVPMKQKRVMEALGLRKINQEKIFNLNACILGMIKKVSHLVKVEEVNEK